LFLRIKKLIFDKLDCNLLYYIWIISHLQDNLKLIFSETFWQENSTWDNPHIVHIKAAVDNNREDLSLPLAPWH
jgi:hypothetical protein